MKRTPILIANWKMHFSVADALAYARELAASCLTADPLELVICPHYLALLPLKQALANTGIRLGAQDAHWADSGAYTGQISASMLPGIVDYILLGHSETRTLLTLDEMDVRRRLAATLRHGLRAIVAIGENAEQHERQQSEAVVGEQVRSIFSEISAEDIARVVIAYEPIWAIGNGRTPAAEAVNQLVSQAIRATLAEKFGEAIAQGIRVVYGGSISTDNCVQFFEQPGLDGALVGGASLKLNSFSEIIDSARIPFSP